MQNKVVLYSTGCPKCNVLKRKLDGAGIKYEVVNDADEMLKLGMKSAPALSVNGDILDFGKAISWVREQEKL